MAQVQEKQFVVLVDGEAVGSYTTRSNASRKAKKEAASAAPNATVEIVDGELEAQELVTEQDEAVAELEAEGLSTSDAQAAVDAEPVKPADGGSVNTLPDESTESREAAKEEALRAKLGLKAMEENLEKKATASSANSRKTSKTEANGKSKTKRTAEEIAEAKAARKAGFSLWVLAEDGETPETLIVNDEPRLLCKGDDPLDKQARGLVKERGRVVHVINNKSGKVYAFAPRKAKATEAEAKAEANSDSK
jgi:hypothetical protein